MSLQKMRTLLAILDIISTGKATHKIQPLVNNPGIHFENI